MAKASIQAVAKEAGVSVSTVSRTFAKPNLVLPKTRDRVLAAARKALAAMEGPLSEPRFETVAPQLMLRDTTAIAA